MERIQVKRRGKITNEINFGKVMSALVPPEKVMEYNFNTQMMVVTYCSQNMKGKPSEQVLTPQDMQNCGLRP